MEAALPALLGFAGAATAALLTILATVFSLRRNLRKEVAMRLTDHRIRWMEDLGHEVANYLGAVARLAMRGAAAPEAVQEYARSATRVQILLNHQDEEYAEVMALMAEIDALLHDAREGGDAPVDDRLAALDDAFVAVADRVIQREWDRTRAHLAEDVALARALRVSRG